MEGKYIGMVDITNKKSTLRTAVAQVMVQVSSQDTIVSIENKTVPKGEVFAMSKAAGLLGVKNGLSFAGLSSFTYLVYGYRL